MALGENVVTLRTERLVLTALEPGDTDWLHRLWTQPRVRQHLWDNRIVSQQEATEVVDEFLWSDRHGGPRLYLIRLRGTCGRIGFVGLRGIDRSRELEILYGLQPEFWGRGLASEAAAACLQDGFVRLAAPRIWARTDSPNLTSQRVMSRLNMHPTPGPTPEDQSRVCGVITQGSWQAGRGKQSGPEFKLTG